MLTSRDIARVRASFAQVTAIEGRAADLFYDRLFEIAPALRRLFPADLREQKNKLMQVIATTVDSLDELDGLMPAVRALGARHHGYGVTAAHYETVGEALLWTLEQGLGKACTPQVLAAWAKVYGALARTMQEGAVDVAELRAAE
jgi:hemoglobin-like flavoprotein